MGFYIESYVIVLKSMGFYIESYSFGGGVKLVFNSGGISNTQVLPYSVLREEH